MPLLIEKSLPLWINLCILCTTSTSIAASKLYTFPNKSSYQALTKQIKQAKHSIKFEVYTFTHRKLANLLINKAKQGVIVQGIIEETPYKRKKVNNYIVKLFKENHIPIKLYKKPKSYLHQKSLIIDNSNVWILTGNFTYSGLYNQRNFAYQTNDKGIIKNITQLFQDDWKNSLPVSLSKQLVISPINSAEKIKDLIDSSKHGLWIYAINLSDKQIWTSLENAAQNQEVELMISKDFPEKLAKHLCKNHLKLHQLIKPKQHAKVIIQDVYDSNSNAYIGSANLSYTSLHRNRELGVITKNPRVTEKLIKQFKEDWQWHSKDICYASNAT